MLCAYIATVVGMFQHWNVHTPRWIGFLIQRPESHSAHHCFGMHAGNYSDVPLWDMVWGTFSNPREFVDVVGFAAPARERVWAMLSGHDVNASD
jgi:sterol desaturase/sphingolipid hydroxylase (fatty acid hydroxylase superfamily)